MVLGCCMCATNTGQQENAIFFLSPLSLSMWKEKPFWNILDKCHHGWWWLISNKWFHVTLFLPSLPISLPQRKQTKKLRTVNSVRVRFNRGLPEFVFNLADFFQQLLQHFRAQNLVDLWSYSLHISNFSAFPFKEEGKPHIKKYLKNITMVGSCSLINDSMSHFPSFFAKKK